MSYVVKPDFIRTIKNVYPSAIVSCTADPYDYQDIDWESAIVDQPTLEQDQIDIYKQLIEYKIRQEANAQRLSKTMLVLGTTDPEQIRTYEEKHQEAEAYLVYDQSPTPIMSSEVTHTGETVATLAPLVVSQYLAAKSLLKSMYGNIEGIRRYNLATVAAMTTIAQLEAYTGPVWI